MKKIQTIRFLTTLLLALGLSCALFPGNARTVQSVPTHPAFVGETAAHASPSAPTKQKVRRDFFKKLKTKFKIKRKPGWGLYLLLSLASLAIVGLIGVPGFLLTQGIALGSGSGLAQALPILTSLLLIVGSIFLLWKWALRKADPEGFKARRERRAKRRATKKMGTPFTPQQQQEEEAIVAQLPGEMKLEVKNASVNICLAEGSVVDGDEVTIFFNDKILLENVKLGKVPQCLDLTLQTGQSNVLMVKTISPGLNAVDRVKLNVDDGNTNRGFFLPTLEGQSASVIFQLK